MELVVTLAAPSFFQSGKNSFQDETEGELSMWNGKVCSFREQSIVLNNFTRVVKGCP